MVGFEGDHRKGELSEDDRNRWWYFRSCSIVIIPKQLDHDEAEEWQERMKCLYFIDIILKRKLPTEIVITWSCLNYDIEFSRNNSKIEIDTLHFGIIRRINSSCDESCNIEVAENRWSFSFLKWNLWKKFWSFISVFRGNRQLLENRCRSKTILIDRIFCVSMCCNSWWWELEDEYYRHQIRFIDFLLLMNTLGSMFK